MYKYQALKYHSDSALVFESFSDQPGAVFLDSGVSGRRQGRYDVISCNPSLTLSGDVYHSYIKQADGETKTLNKPLLDVLQDYQSPDFMGRKPFNTGLIGYLSYDYGKQLILPELSMNIPQSYELGQFGLYHWSIIVDHQKQVSWICYDERLISLAEIEQIQGEYQASLTSLSGQQTSNIHSDLTEEEYQLAFSKIQAYLLEGDCYQVNFANRFSTTTTLSDWQLYRRLRELSSAPYSAFMRFSDISILSASPELFLNFDSFSRQVLTKPIKGTVPRGATESEDLNFKQQLVDSEKDRAENLMIVDLLRNDLGKVCEAGSIEVPELFQLESFSNVHHLVSSVVGTLAPQNDVISLLKATLPGGSITGAPKKRAMEIIDELEATERGVYCGAMGYIDSSGNMQMNIAIRTLVMTGNKLEYWAGGGIVADSAASSEWAELRNKASDIYQAIQQSD